ncbi:MAG: lipase maturation factor family protein, partial [Verrucomicrobiae bacterium]|nr:lipase maturation factor family protein [Verrucomicrobiae bacterium]
LCWGGAVLSLLLIVGVATVPVCALLWTFYLSIATAGQEFMEFQWDILLLEAGFLAIFLAPGGFWNGLKLRAPHRIVVWLFGWLVFRLMFESGMVKLVSGDPSWRHFTALSYHYETQPLPTPLAWWFHHAPHGFQTASAVGILAIEVGAPFLILGPRRLRHFACFAFCGLQLLILLTGNYGFFNLLTIALTLTLLDDGFWPESWKARLRAGDDDETLDSGAPAQPRASRWPGPLIWPVAAVIVALSTAGLINVLRIDVDWPEWVQTAYGRAAAFRSVNSYGLFAVMTTDRDEVVVEGSNDGVNWLQYGFKFKPGDPNRAPPFVAPHMPRLDWQMWFAALGDYRQQRWFLRFCGRIMEGSPEVLALLDRNPFGDKPPRYLRAVLYHYAFSDPETSRRNGAWWRREPLRLYAPVMRFAEKPSPPRKPARH